MLNWFRKLFGGPAVPPRVPTDTSPGGVYSQLRAQALSAQRGPAGIPAPPPDGPVWGVLMESGYPKATATLFALADGTTSLYLSTGGGVIGGQGHASVRAANAALLETANRYRAHWRPASSCPIPAVGETHFYLLTDAGVLTGGAREDDLGHDRHPVSAVFHAGHGVFTELRLISEAGGE